MTLDETWAKFEAVVARLNARRKYKLHYGVGRQFRLDGTLGQYRAWIGDGEDGAGYGASVTEAIEASMRKVVPVATGGSAEEVADAR